MDGNDIFVGRQRELERFQEVLADSAGQAVVVVGPSGMGKTWLVNKMAQAAKEHPTLRCGVVRYELVSRDSVDIVMERMMDDAFRAGEVVEGTFDATAHRRKQWYALLETVVPKGDKVAKLMQSFQRDVKRPVREEFIDRLRLISGKMGENGRAIFVIDPWEYLAKDCAEDWAIVIRELPEKVKFVFAQRPEDAIARYRKFMGLKNTIRIPTEALGGLNEKAVDELLDIRAGETKYTIVKLRDGLRRFGRHPYALQGAINLLAEGREIDTLPDDPTETGVIEQQWEEICAHGEEAIRLFKAFAILWVSVPNDVVERVAEMGSDRRLALLASSGFLGRLIARDEDSGRLYHVLLAEYIGNRMSEEEKRGYHERAVAVYRAKLTSAKESQSQPDELSAVQLSEHVRAAEGAEGFVKAFVNECCRALSNLGRLEVCVDLSREALEAVEEGGLWQAVLYGNLGLIYQTQGKSAEAEAMHKKSLKIHEKLGRLEGIASNYGNLGRIYQAQGKLAEAEAIHNKSLKIHEKLGRPEGIANQYCNLGVVYHGQGKLAEAEVMFNKSLEISEKFGRLEGLAISYGNLGEIYQMQGKLAEAEAMHKKSLEIEKKLGRLEGMASDYGNLGLIYRTRGKLDKARAYWGKALEIYERIGMPHMVEKMRGWIEDLGEGEGGIE